MILSEGSRNFTSWMLAGPLVLAVFLATPKNGSEKAVSNSLENLGVSVNATSLRTGQNTTQSTLAVPPGTILPVRLAASISSGHSKAGEVVTAKLMQDVPLLAGQKIPRGSSLYGKLVAIVPTTANGGVELSLQFDSLRVHNDRIPLTTHLRAIAGYVDVEQAQIPVLSSGEGEVYAWLPTVQIGGDNVFGQDGTVTGWNDSTKVVGQSTPYGVLGRVTPSESGGCRGPLYGNDRMQALWVFSSDACGVYGLPHVAIAHAGRDNPIGLIVLRLTGKNVHLPSGTGLLLRVDEPAK